MTITKEQLQAVADQSTRKVELLMHQETPDGCISMRREVTSTGAWEYSVERHFEQPDWDKKGWQDMPCKFECLHGFQENESAAVSCYMGYVSEVQS